MSNVDRAHWCEKNVPCAICSSERYRVLGYHGGWAHHRGLGIASRIVRCRDCGFIYANPTPFPRDHSHYADTDQYFRTHQVEQKVAACRALLGIAEELRDGRKGRLLDIGCGRGESLVAARESGWEAEGIEPSEDFARYGRETLGVNVRHGFIEQTDYQDGEFDFVILNAVLEHVYEPMPLLQEARRLLRPGGLIFLDVPNEAGLYFTLGSLFFKLQGRKWSLNLSPTFEPYHVAGFSPRTLNFALERAGFRTERMRTYPAKFSEGQLSRKKLIAARLLEKLSRLTNSGSFLEAWGRAV